MQNRQMADREIQEALNKYQVIIQEQVEKQRSEIKTSKKPAASGGNNANVWYGLRFLCVASIFPNLNQLIHFTL